MTILLDIFTITERFVELQPVLLPIPLLRICAMHSLPIIIDQYPWSLL